MVATDMVSAKGGNPNRAMVLLQVSDLVNWRSSIGEHPEKVSGARMNGSPCTIGLGTRRASSRVEPPVSIGKFAWTGMDSNYNGSIRPCFLCMQACIQSDLKQKVVYEEDIEHPPQRAASQWLWCNNDRNRQNSLRWQNSNAS